MKKLTYILPFILLSTLIGSKFSAPVQSNALVQSLAVGINRISNEGATYYSGGGSVKYYHYNFQIDPGDYSQQELSILASSSRVYWNIPLTTLGYDASASWATLTDFKVTIDTTDYHYKDYDIMVPDMISFDLPAILASSVTPISVFIPTTHTAPISQYNDALDDTLLMTDASALAYVFGSSEYGYLQGYEDGLSEGLLDNQSSIFNAGYTSGFSDGYDSGVLIAEGEAYDEGYLDGSNDSFMANFDHWIVPAIIVVLFLGGAISIWSYKKRSNE